MTDLLEKQKDKFSSEDSIRQFVDEIRLYPRLTMEEERLLAAKCVSGDEAAIRQMVSSNLRLVVSVAREYAGRGVPLLDLIQEGSIGLLAAARKFDYTLDYRFSTYATKWIRQGVTRCLVNHGRIIRIPLHTAERVKKVEAARSLLQSKNGTDPSAEEIASIVGYSPEKVRELLSLVPNVCSLDYALGEDDKNTLGDLVGGIESSEPFETVVRKELERTLGLLLSTLTERQQKILRLHFGLEDGIGHSLEEIGKMMGISKERVRQVEKQAIEKLQAQGASLGLEDFLE